MRRYPALSLLALLYFVSSLAAQTYRNPSHTALPGAQSTIFTGDFNGDGVPDLFYFDSTAFNLNVALAQSDGSYTVATPTGIAAANVAFCTAVDVNEDRFADLICPSRFGAAPEVIAIYLGNGDGSFQSPRNISYPDGSGTNLHDPVLNEVLAADVNGDGHIDLILSAGYGSSQQTYKIYAFLGDGSGSFPSIATTVSPNGHFLYSDLGGTTFLDINHDSHIDIYTSLSGSYLGKGDGTFQWVGRSGTPQNATLCFLADFDGDGMPDEACAGQVSSGIGYISNYSLDIFHGNGDGTFGRSLYHAIYPGADFYYPLRAQDLNGDGIVDIIAQTYDGYAVLLGKPGLQFAPPVQYALINFNAIAGTSSYFVQDYNHDGQIDLAIQGPDGLYILYGHPDGSFDSFPLVEAGTDMGSAVIADFNNDGKLDVITSGNVDPMLSLGAGDGTFAPATAIHPAAGSVNVGQYDSSYVLAGDFNGDGTPDFITSSLDTPGSSGVFYLFPGNGDGTFANPVPVTYPSGVLFPPASRNETQPLQYKIVDLNGDNRQDILTYGGNSNKGVNTLLSSGDGSFSVISNPYSATITDPPVLAFADFNNDGNLDVVVLTNTANQLLLGTGGGNFAAAATTPPAPLRLSPADFGSAVAGDFDGDGNQDVAVLLNVDMTPESSGPGYSNNGISQIWVYYGHGDGSFSSAVLAASSSGQEYYRNLTLTGPNNQGLPDFVASNNESASIGRSTLSTGVSLSDLNGYAAVVHNLPGRTFSPITPLVSGLSVTTLAAVDFNNDGFSDLFVANGRPAVFSDGNAFEVLLNSGGPIARGLLSASPEPSQIHQPFTLNATLQPSGGGTLAGNVSFTIDGNPVGSAILSGNVASLAAPTTLTAGQHNLTARWPGDSTYPPAVLSNSHFIVGVGTSTGLTSSLNPALVGTPVTFTATVSDPTATGGITFRDGPTILGFGSLNSGVATFSTSSLNVGSHPITATFSGDANFAASTSPVLTQAVPAVGTTSQLLAAPGTVSVGDNIQLTTTVANSVSSSLMPSGTVTYYDGSTTLGTATLDASGKTSITAVLTTFGNHSLTAQYGGDATHTASSSSPAVETVNAIATATSLISSVSQSTVGQSVTFTATVTPTPGSAAEYLLPGVITFKEGSTTLGTAAVTLSGSGSASAMLSTSSLSVGSHSITASYGGNTAASASIASSAASVQILSATTTALATSSRSSPFGQNITFTATVTGTLSDIQGGQVHFLSNGVILSSVNVDANGVAVYQSATLPVGLNSVNAAFVGTANAAASASLYATINISRNSTVVTVASSANPATTNQQITFTATSNLKQIIGTETMTFRDGSTVLGTAPIGLSPLGSATFSTNSLALGSHNITAVYAGNTDDTSAVSGTLVQRVQNATSITLASSPSPSAFGQNIVLTATVSGSSSYPVSDTVTFSDGATVLGSSSINPAGVATFSATSLAIGAHTLTAVFNGDANLTASTSTPISQTVKQFSTTTALTSSLNPSSSGQSITLTATISGVSSYPGSDTVIFKDGANTLGTGNVSSAGVATFSISSLTTGSHSLTAVFSGDTNSIPSTSVVISQIVNTTPTTTTLTTSPASPYQGQALTLTTTIAPASASGTVQFSEGSTVLGSAAVQSGSAIITISTLSAGAHTITANYTGDTNNSASASAASTVIVQAPTVSVGPGSPTVTAAAGQTITDNITLSGLGAITDTIQFTATGVPTYATATFSPSSVNLAGGGSASTMLTITTTTTSSLQPLFGRKGTLAFAALSLPLSMLLLPSIFRRKRLLGLLGIFAASILVLAAGGCGGAGGSSGGSGTTTPTVHNTAPGTYAIQVVATGVNTHVTQSTSITVVVQ